MKNLTLIIAFIIGTSFALSAQRGGSNNNTNANSNTRSNTSIRNGQVSSNPNLGMKTTKREGSNYGRNGSSRPGSTTGRGGGRPGNGYNNGHNNGHGHNNNNNHHGHNNGHGHHNNNNHHGHNNGHGHHNNNNHHGHSNGHGHHNNNNHHGHNNGHGHTTVVVHNNHNNHGHNYNGYCSYTNHNFGWAPVCNSVYVSGCNTIWACGFDSDRLRSAKRFVRNNYVNARQIAHIMGAFSFESSKLAFAKYAFNRTCDVQNYGQVFDKLCFNSSRRELDAFIQNYYW